MPPRHYNRRVLPHGAAVDPGRRFLCDTLTPLYYTPVWAELTPEQRLSYNQISATYWNELIAWFELELATGVLEAVQRRAGGPLAARLRAFLAEEHEHAETFRQLNLLSDRERYAANRYSIVKVPRVASTLLKAVARCGFAGALVWVMLILEERSIAVTETSARSGIDPLYARVYAEHARDERRHVHLDLELLETLHDRRPAWLRAANAKLFRVVLSAFLLRPGAASARTIDVLVARHPELAPKKAAMLRELRALGRDRRYHEMMYSRASVPQTFARLDRHPEMQPLRRVLLSYL